MKTNFDAMKKKQDTPKVGVCVILQKDDGTILVMRRKGSHRNGSWALPGGHMEVGEEFKDTCKREVMEELNIVVDDVFEYGFVNNIFEEEGLHYVTLYFEAQWDTKQIPEIMEPEKIAEIRWVNPENLPSPFFSKNAIELLGKLAPIDMSQIWR